MKPNRTLCALLFLNLFQFEAWADLDPIVRAANVFVISDATVNVSNIQGKATIQGNGSFRTGRVGSIYNLGDLSLNVMTVQSNVAVAGSLTLKASHIGSITHLDKPGDDFKAINQSLLEESAALGSWTTNGLIDVNQSKNLVTLTGSDANLNVFETKPLWFNCALMINVPDGSTVVVNMPGEQIDLSLVSLNIRMANHEKIHPTQLIFNFPQATSISISASHISGTVLAPLADISARSLAIEGGLIAKRLTMATSNLYHFPFQGNLTTGNRTFVAPEPLFLRLHLLALLLVAVISRNRRTQKRGMALA